MQRHSSLLVLGLAICVLSACDQAPAPVDTAADVTAINALRANVAAAFNAGDAQKLAALYTDDAVAMPNFKPALVGNAAILKDNQATFSMFSVQMKLTADETKVMGDVAYDRGNYEISLTPKDPKMPGMTAMSDKGGYLVILHRQADKSWKVHRDIDNSSNPPPAPAPAPAKGK